MPTHAADPLAFGLLLSAFGGGALVGTLLGGVPQLSARWGQWITGAIASFGSASSSSAARRRRR